VDPVRKTNDRYVIRLVGKDFAELYERGPDGWRKTSARGRVFPATAEQVLNHLLPALAGLGPGLAVRVDYRGPMAGRPAHEASGGRRTR
jgi:hypothetical protein